MSNDEDDKRDSAPDESDSSDESSSNEATSSDAERDDAGTESSESEPSESASSASTSAPLAKTEPASGTGSRMSAGARLAAAKAAKAVVKASKKEERKASTQTEVSTEPTEAEPVEAAPVDPVKELEESELGRAALRAGKWWESNQQIGWIAVAVAALAIVGFLGFQYHKDTTSAAVGVLLEDAVDIASARIVPEGEEPASDDGEEEDADAAPTFPTRAARNEAALEAYQAVIAQYPDHASAGIARLGAARALLALGRNEEAQDMYQQAFDRNGRSGVIAWQALEGVGFAQEAAGNPGEAQATYERLGNLEDHAYEQVANYHLARLMLARGERDEARTALRELVDSLRADTLEGSSEPRFPYLLSQAEVRLRELDPSSATSAGGMPLGGPGGPGGSAGGLQLGGGEGGEIDPAQLQELIRQFQARQQGGGEGGGGEGGGE